MSLFIDTIALQVRGGDGGAGSTSFRREKFVAKGGPDGGDGGKGGSVYLKACNNMQSFIDLKQRNKRSYCAQHGKPGLGKKKFGSAGQDLVIEVPVGTLVFNQDKELIFDLAENGSTYLIAQGGKGGLGNANFSSSINQSPQYSQPGLKGELKYIQLELRLLAEIGLIGLPNAGKSSLLKCLTNANVKIDNYPFTTLFPNLGTLKTYEQEIIIADIPGLIEGASKGKGLGQDFLRHIDRTHSLIHLIACEDNPEITLRNYNITLAELKESPYNLQSKYMLNVLSKSDLVDESTCSSTIDLFKHHNIDIYPISSFTNEGISRLIKDISQIKLNQ